MNLENVKKLAKILNEAGLSALEVCEGENKIRLEKAVVTNFAAAPVPAPAPALITDKTLSVKTAAEIDFNNISEFKAPMIGVFYSASSPAAKPFVKIGQKVKKGDVLCIIEAMKVMNEVVSDRDGEIVDICVQNGQVVEYSQVLFKIF